jgi:hypothetical protein
MPTIGASNDEIGDALQQREEGNQKEKQPAAKTAKSKFQR